MRGDAVLRPSRLYRQTPTVAANTGRNLLASSERWRRWAPARDQLWQLVDQLIAPSARVAVIGAGNCHDLPLTRLAARVSEVALIDIDRRAPRRARRRLSPALRPRVRVVEHDVTAGAADAIVAAAGRGQVPDRVVVTEAPLPGAPYDLVIGDLLYSQLLYPAMLDLNMALALRRGVLGRYGPALVRDVVARLHASAPYGRVVHVHDPLGWWPGHLQPVALSEILAAGRRDVGEALGLIAGGSGPTDADPRAALRHFAIPVRATRLWCWPFDCDIDYLVCATLAGGPPLPSVESSQRR